MLFIELNLLKKGSSDIMKTLNKYLDNDVKELLDKKNLNYENFPINIGNPEIDVEKIARELGCKIEHKFLISKAGTHDYETSIITVNALDPVYRQRFTIAHEIGHKVYNHKGIRNRTTQDQIDAISQNEESRLDVLIERQANSFASKLLMPKKLLTEVKNKLEDNKEIRSDRQRIIKLAEKFNVSYIAMEYRLGAINDNE